MAKETCKRGVGVLDWVPRGRGRDSYFNSQFGCLCREGAEKGKLGTCCEESFE